MTEHTPAPHSVRHPRAAGTPPRPKNQRALLVDLSVLAMSALVLGGAMLIVADVDSSRSNAPVATSETSALKDPSAAASHPTPPLPPTQAPSGAALVASAAPSGFVPAPRARRRVVVVRRSRAS